MYAGAALSAISAILVIVVSSTIKNAIIKAANKANATNASEGKKTLTATQIHDVANVVVVIALVILLIGVALWLWMAWANGRGSNWARIVATVLFGLNTIYLVLVVARAGTSTLFVALGWLVGLGAIIMLWQRDSTAYFQAGRR
jgi:hypothetical protein